MSKKIILFFILNTFTFSLIISDLKASDIGKIYPSEKKLITDPITGIQLTVLTSSSFSDIKPYQTHDTWTCDGKWIVFHSKRVKDISQLFIVNEHSGEIMQLTDYPDVIAGTVNLSRKEMKLFYICGSSGSFRIVELNLDKLISESFSESLKSPEHYERIVTLLPSDITGYELALDSDESCLYWGAILNRPELTLKAPPFPVNGKLSEQRKYREELRAYNEMAAKGNSAIYKINIADGRTDKIIDINFRMGHLQANPWMPGEIIYCKESGGDTDQRMWTVRKDGSNNSPVYIETLDEWITHESVCGKDELMFIISGHSPYLRERPTGIAIINLRTNQVELLGQVKEESNQGGFWHCNGSPDSHWAVGDTHAGSIYLIDRSNGKRVLLTTGHRMRPDHTHPIFSADSKRILIQSGMLTDGKNLNLMIINLPVETNL